MALDDRIVAAAPGCYLTGFRSLLSTIGVQDAEQNIHGQLKFGMDHADYVIMRMPKPTLIMAATDDYFDIKGAWNLFREGKRVATKLGFPDRVELVEPDTKHGFPPQMQLAAANWFRRWLLDLEPMEMPEVKALPEEELNVTSNGSVLELDGARTIFELNAEWEARLAAKRRTALPARSAQTHAAWLGKVRELIGARELTNLPKPDERATSYGFALHVEDGIALPGKLKPRQTPARQLKYAIYLGWNKEKIHQLTDQGVSVLVVSLRGLGSTKPEGTRPSFDELFGTDWRETTMASLLGKTYVGMRTEDIWQCVRFLRQKSGLPDLKPDLIAEGEAGIPALHAAALEPDLFGDVTIIESLESWADVLKTPETRRQQAGLVYGALHHYDLPDLASTLGKKLSLVRPIRADGAISPPPVSHRAEGTRAAVATAHPIATEAALNMLKSGGNAVDAAVTAGLTLGVVDGHNSGIGGGCFMIVRNPDGEIFAFDGREMAPAAAHRDMFVKRTLLSAEEAAADKSVRFTIDTQASKTGPLASGIPGSLAVYDHVLKTFGKRSLEACLQAGIEISERGFPVDAAWATKARSNRKYFAKFGYPAEVLMPNGVSLNAGDILRQPDLAETYRLIARDGISHFYQGDFAAKTVAWMAKNGGIITAEDFANYKIQIREPVRSTYRGYEIVGMPPPSSGGIHVAQILNILENFDLANLDQTDRTHVLIEAMKLAFADRAHWLGDSDYAKVPNNLASRKYADELAQRINLSLATEVPRHSVPPNADDIFGKHTTHFTVADSEGWWVACTATVNTSFGSKVMIPGTGVILNNQMDDFSIQPGVPNAFGLIGAGSQRDRTWKTPAFQHEPHDRA